MTTVQVPAGTLSAATAATPAARVAGINAVGAVAAPRPAKAWVDPQVTRHTLYVGQAVSTAVECDGLALRITPNGQSTQRVPLPRLARVLSGPAARWSGAALLACAEARVPVVFASGAQQAGACVVAPQQRSGRLDAEFTLMAEGPQAEAAWAEGLRCLRARLLAQWWQQVGLGPEQGPAWEDAHRQFVYHGPAERLRLVSQLDARCYAVVVDQLQQEGLALRYPTRRGRWLELALDLAVTLQALHALQAPMDGRARTAARLRAQAFETSEAVQVDLLGWCLLILRRSALEHTQPWL